MKKTYGWTGTLLRVNLSSKKVEQSSSLDRGATDFIGGRYLLLDFTGTRSQKISTLSVLTIY